MSKFISSNLICGKNCESLANVTEQVNLSGIAFDLVIGRCAFLIWVRQGLTVCVCVCVCVCGVCECVCVVCVCVCVVWCVCMCGVCLCVCVCVVYVCVVVCVLCVCCGVCVCGVVCVCVCVWFFPPWYFCVTPCKRHDNAIKYAITST